MFRIYEKIPLWLFIVKIYHLGFPIFLNLLDWDTQVILDIFRDLAQFVQF